MSDGDLIDLDANNHLIRCPHCQKQMVHKCPGGMILFAPAKCLHCGREFVIALNKPQTGP